MSILNIGLQSVSVTRAEVGDNLEKVTRAEVGDNL